MRKFIKKYNLGFFIPFIVLMIMSFLGMYQAKFIKEIYSNHLLKQVIWFLLGIVIIVFLKKVKIKIFFKYSKLLYIIGNILLVLVLFFGKEINGSRAWFDFKFFNLQPSEFMKLFLLLYLAKITSEFKGFHPLFYILKCIIITLIPSILVFLEPDSGAIIFYLLILISTLLLSGIKKRWFILFWLVLILFIGIFIYLYNFNQDLLIKLIGTSFFYRVDRLLNIGDGMQVSNALITMGNAGLFGHGIQKSLLYVPEFPTDFIFTLSIAMFGFIGGVIILGMYFIMDLFFLKRLVKEKRKEYKIFIQGFLNIFLFLQIQNILMNLGLLPIMGIPLPFLSYGGSSMIVTCIFVGIILNFS